MSIHPLFVANVQTGDSIKIQNESGVIYDSSDVNIGYVRGQDKEIQAIVCDGYSTDDKWRVLNIVNGAGVLLDNIAVLGAVSDDQVIRLSQRYLNVDLENNKVLSHADVNDQALKYFLDGATLPTRTQYFLQKDADILANLPTKNEVKWSDETGALISHNGNLAQVMYDMAVSDLNDDLLAKVTPKDIISMLVDDQCEMQMYDAMVMKYRNLTNAMNKIAEAMKGLTDDEFHVVSVTPIEPFKRQGVVNVGAIFEMSDTQQVTVLFNNPDATPSKLTDSDVITSWKWMLNKRDVTAALQPKAVESRKYPMIANRLMKLLVKNHSRFVRAQSRKLKEEADLKDVTEQLEASLLDIQNAQQRLDDLQNQIDAETAKKQQETQVIASKEQVTTPSENNAKAKALTDLLVSQYGYKITEESDENDVKYSGEYSASLDRDKKTGLVVYSNLKNEDHPNGVPLFIDSGIYEITRIDVNQSIEAIAKEIESLIEENNRGGVAPEDDPDAIIKPMDLPEGYALNQIAFDHWKLSHVDLVGSVVDIYLDKNNGTYVAAFENGASETTSAKQADINEALIWGIGAIREAINAKGEKTKYSIKSENPRARKPQGSLTIQPIQGGFDLFISIGTTGGGFVAQNLEQAKNWIRHRMAKLGSGDPTWNEVKQLLTLESGKDYFNVVGEQYIDDKKAHAKAVIDEFLKHDGWVKSGSTAVKTVTLKGVETKFKINVLQKDMVGNYYGVMANDQEITGFAQLYAYTENKIVEKVSDVIKDVDAYIQARMPVEAEQANTATEYRYTLHARPFVIGNTPSDGFVRVDEAGDYSAYARHGIAVYSRPLTDIELQRFEMKHIPSDQDYADAIQAVAQNLAQSKYATKIVAQIASNNLSATERWIQKIRNDLYPFTLFARKDQQFLIDTVEAFKTIMTNGGSVEAENATNLAKSPYTVDDAYKFADATDEFKKRVSASIHLEHYSPFNSAKTIDRVVKQNGATISWGEQFKGDDEEFETDGGVIRKNGEVVGRAVISMGDGKSIIYVGESGGERPSDHRTARYYFTYDEETLENMTNELFTLHESRKAAANETPANEDKQFLESIISGDADLSAVGDRLMSMGENLDLALNDLFEQAAEKYAEFAIANAASV